MKIDSKTGALEVAGSNISPALTWQEFSKSSLFWNATEVIKNEEWLTYLLRLREGQEEFALNLVFKGGTLLEIHFSIDDPEASWATWSNEKEFQYKARIDAILEQCLGAPPYSFGWGEAVSAIDTRGAGSQGILRYKPKYST